MERTELEPPAWVNDPGLQARASRARENALRMIALEEAADLQRRISDDCERMQNQAWFERPGRLAALGPSIALLCAAVGFVIVAAVLIYFGAVWTAWLFRAAGLM